MAKLILDDINDDSCSMSVSSTDDDGQIGFCITCDNDNNSLLTWLSVDDVRLLVDFLKEQIK